jgi:RimJ/RimL family protein N-acetyltransferase
MITYDPYWGPMIARRAGCTFNPECDSVVARTRTVDGFEELMGGSIYQNFTEESIGIHVAHWVPNWINRELLFQTFGYPFLQLGVERIFGQVAADNPAALKFDLHLGFKEIARIPKVFRAALTTSSSAWRRGLPVPASSHGLL